MAAGPDGHLYNVHDPGDTVLMLPAAALRVVREPGLAPGIPDDVTAFAVSVSYAFFAAFGLLALMYALRHRLGGDRRRAVLVTLVFVFATSYAAYQKTAWDVLGACLGTCLVLGAVTLVERRHAAGAPSRWAYAAVGASLALTASFRFTWAPFLSSLRGRVPPAHLA